MEIFYYLILLLRKSIENDNMIGAANVGDLLDGVKDVVQDGIERGLDEAVDGLDEAADAINYGITNQV